MRATYRVQLTPSFGFQAARELVDYLHELGVSHLYVSPCLEAVRGSQHGYDVVDHTRARGELGGEAGFDALCAALRAHDLGLLLDIVPNHMAIGTPDNALWWDVLENGPASEYAAFFDVDWDAAADNRVLLPVLGERYAEALEQGRIRVELREARVVVRYGEQTFPAAPRSVSDLLAGIEELRALSEGLDALPNAWTVDREGALRRRHAKTALYAQLERMLHEQPALEAAVVHATEQLTADADRLDAWLERQNWRLSYWKAAATELGYRRFFDVQSLAGLRMEDPVVFEATHARILEWVREGKVTGLRIDHPDGLRDPERYLRRLHTHVPGAYLAVEKILEADEALRTSWPVNGTTGYDFMRLLDQVQVDPSGEPALSALAEEVAGGPQDWSAMVRAAKHEILKHVLTTERDRVVELAHRALTRKRAMRDASRAELRSAITQLLASYDGYRSYVRASGPLDAHDRATITRAIARAREVYGDGDERLWAALEAALTLSPPYEDAVDLALSLQQLTSAVAAKAVEDTAGYRYLRLLALNEVGGSPGIFGMTREAFNLALEQRSGRGSTSMLATATHDTKRGEDVRARLLVLSELAEPWSNAVRAWLAKSQHLASAPLDRATQYVFLQTLVGAFPLSVERAIEYMRKATREARLHTSWTAPDAAYDQALERYVRGVLGDEALMRDIEAFVQTIAQPGFVASLARTLVKLTAPGVPDIYQGGELWDLSLVDPDNRRPVDFTVRRRLLARVAALAPEDALAELARGTPKLWLIAKALQLRASKPLAFEGAYEPLVVTGEGESAVLAYARGAQLLVVVPRWPVRAARLGPDVRVRLPEGRFCDAFTGDPLDASGDSVSVQQLWARFPVALLMRAP